MLNYILPPIIIIVCVSLLIMFLFKKAGQLPEKEIENDEINVRKSKKLTVIMSSLGQFGLKILEKLMHRAKLMSLKFHNRSNDLFQSIKEKRQEKLKLHQELLEGESEENETVESVSDVKHSKAVKEKVFESTVQKPYSVSEEVKPMIKEEVTKPQPAAKVIEKNKFEDALIKRIAINPRDIEAYERLGDYYLESNNHQDSLECFKQVLRLSPTHQKARLRIRRIERMIK